MVAAAMRPSDTAQAGAKFSASLKAREAVWSRWERVCHIVRNVCCAAVVPAGVARPPCGFHLDSIGAGWHQGAKRVASANNSVGNEELPAPAVHVVERRDFRHPAVDA